MRSIAFQFLRVSNAAAWSTDPWLAADNFAMSSESCWSVGCGTWVRAFGFCTVFLRLARSQLSLTLAWDLGMELCESEGFVARLPPEFESI